MLWLFAVLFAVSSFQFFVEAELSCQIGSKWIRMMHVQDVSPGIAPYMGQWVGTDNPGVEKFDTWIGSVFTSGVSQGIMSFSQKQDITGDSADRCTTTNRNLATGSVVADYEALSAAGSLPAYTGRSVIDAIYAATQINWNSPFTGGRRFIVVQVSGSPSVAGSSSLPAFDGTFDCESYDFPDISSVLVPALSASFATLIIMTPPALADAYAAIFNDSTYPALIVPLIADADTQFDMLQSAIDYVYCGAELPTFPAVTTEQPITTEAPCSEDAILNLVHLQDISWSYTNDLPNMKAKFPDLFSDLQAKFFKSYVGLGSFSDKPVSPFGYYGDYCFREHTPLTEDDAVFTAALDSLKIKSGRDWKESQYDAIWEALHSLSMGWETSDEVDGHQVLRVVMLATDAGPHVAGDRTGVPAASPGASCAATDYPSAAALGTELDGKKVYPIFVVTSDLYNYWVNRAAQVAPNAVVLHLSQPSEDVFAAIETALEDICQTDRRRRRLVVER